MDTAKDVVWRLWKEKLLRLERDENIHDVVEAIAAFAERVELQDESRVEQDVAIILSVLDYLTPEAEKKYGLNPVFPKPEDVRDYIRRKRKGIVKNAKKNSVKRAEVKARVNKDGFEKARNAKGEEKISPFGIFYFFGTA